MGLSLASIGKKIEGLGAQVNPFDNGATYNTVLQNRPPAAAIPVQGHMGGDVMYGGYQPPSTVQQVGAFGAGFIHPFSTLGSGLLNTPDALWRELHNQPINDIQQKVFGTTDSGSIAKQIGGDTLAAGSLALGGPIARGAEGIIGASAARPLVVGLSRGLGEAATPKILTALPTRMAVGGITGGAVNTGLTGAGLISSGTPLNKSGKPLAEAAGLGVGLGVAGPPAGAIVKHAVTMPKNEVGAVGRNVLGDGKPNVPKVVKAADMSTPPDFLKPTTVDKVIANSTGSTPKAVAAGRRADLARLEADRASLNHLKSGGTRDEAVSIYQKATGRTLGQSQYRVQQLAKQAKTSLNVSPKIPNPLSGQFHLPNAKSGDFSIAPQNRLTVNTNIDRALQNARNTFKGLSLEERQQVPHVIEGTLKTDNPAIQAAAKASQRLTDTVHAVGEPYGTTPHIGNYFPRYFADHAAQPPEIQMAQEEAALANHGQVPLEDQGNYAGFHNKSRIFKTRQEAQDAGFVLKNQDPLADLERYASGAKINIGNQAFIKAARQADTPTTAEALDQGSMHTIDLPGNGGVKVSSQAFKKLKGYAVRPAPGVAKRALQGVNKSVVRTIVANPIFHGGNQEFNSIFQTAWRIPGNRVANMAKIIKNHATINEGDVNQFYKDGGFSPTYGKDDYGFIAKGIQKLGGNPAAAEASPRAMAAIEQNIRVSLSKLGKERGMSPDEINGVINKTLGGPDVINDFSSTYGLFQHYFQTQVKLLGDVGVQATKGHVAPLAGLALGTAAWFAATKAWQDATGNKNATVRAPGVLGTALQLGKAPGQIRNGQIPGVVRTHTNPAIVTSLEHATNRDFSNPLVGALGQNNNLDGKRLKVTASNLFGPGQTIQSVAGQKTSPAEAALGYATGLYTPHAKGHQAAPNIPALNKKGAQPGTGLDEQKQYFAAHDTLLKTIYGDKRASDAVNTYLDRNHNAQGQSVQLNPEESIAAYKGLAGNSKALAAVQKFEQSANKSHPPMWDLSRSDLKSFLEYEGTVKTDPTKAVKLDLGGSFNNGEGLSSFIKRNSAWYGDQPAHPGPGSVAAPGTPAYPNVPSAALNQYSGLKDPSQKAQFLDSHPEVIQAFNNIAKYNNQLGVAQGGNALKNYPEASTQLQSFMNTYSGASKAQRKSIRAASPQQYQNMIAFFDSVDLYNINKTGAKDQYQGEPDQTSGQNKAISSLAKDIYQSPDGSYSIQPAGWMQGLSNSSSGGSGSYTKKHYVSPRTLRGQNPAIAYDKIRGKKVSLKGKGTGKGKVVAKGGKGRPTVAIKKSLV